MIKEPVRQIAFHFDAAACSGCKACQVACKDKHGLEVGRLWRRVYEVSGGGWRQVDGAWLTDAFAYNLSIGCNHCRRPICAELCPAQAISKRDDGIVLLDGDKCLGCGYCRWGCPYDALQYDESAGQMSKCTFCYDEIDAGRPPACVAACPMRVLDYGDISQFQNGSGGHGAPLPDPALTQPALAIKPHRDSHRSRNEPARVIPGKGSALKENSLIAFTLLAQSAIGAFLFLGLTAAWLGQTAGRPLAMKLIQLGAWTAAPLMIAGLLLSLAHLGRPSRAYRALANLRSSWLSREILFASLFTGTLLLLTGLSWQPGQSWRALTWTTIAASLAGIGLMISMTRVYMLRTVSSWSNGTTPASFSMTAFTLGAGSAGAVLLFSHNWLIAGLTLPDRPLMASAMNALALILVVAATVQGMVFRVWLAASWPGSGESGASSRHPLPSLPVFRLRLAATFIGALLLAAALYGHTLASFRSPFAAGAVLSGGLLAFGEVLGRRLFYQAYTRSGV